MKQTLRKLCRPLLDIFEKGEGPYAYKPQNRTILIFLGVLFVILGLAVMAVALGSAGVGVFLPVIIFGGAGVVCLIVGTLGSDRAVSRIWGGR